MKNLLTASLIMLVCVPCFAVEKSTSELNSALGKWALDSIQAGMQNEQLMSAIRVKAKEILAKNGIILPSIPKVEPEQPEPGQVSKKKGPPDWAPAKGWRRKFGNAEEEALGQHLTKKIAEGTHGDGLLTILRQQIERVSKGQKVGDEPKTVEAVGNPSGPGGKPSGVGGPPSDRKKAAPGKPKSKGKGKN